MYGSSLLVFDTYAIIGKYMDLSLREFILFFAFGFITIFCGFFPNFIMYYFVGYCEYLEITLSLVS